ncbi:MAG: hypothetical protein H6972_04195 [Gammaproteobacteria bacterium]|nr:hypothetical protein [Gammaproteobacteria bacterium]
MNTFAQYWPILLTVGAGFAAVSKFYLDWLKIRELQYKLSEQKEKEKQSSSPIHRPTSEEIEKYGRPSKSALSRPLPITSTVLSLFLVAVISSSFLFYQYQDIVSSSPSKTIEHQNSEKLRNKKLVFRSIGTSQGQEYWLTDGVVKFREEIQRNGNPLSLDGESPELLEFRNLGGNHFEALFRFNKNKATLKVTFLFVRGPKKYWFVVSDMESVDEKA